MNREKRIRRLFAIKKVAAVHPPPRKLDPSDISGEDFEMADEWYEEGEEAGEAQEDGSSAMPRQEFLDKSIHPTQRGPKSEEVLDDSTQFIRSQSPVPIETETGEIVYDNVIIEPEKAGPYEKYLGAKFDSKDGAVKWATTPASDLMFFLANKTTAPKDPARGFLKLPPGHPYKLKFSTPDNFKFYMLTQSAERLVLNNLSNISSVLNAATPNVAGTFSLRDDTSVVWHEEGGEAFLLISDSRGVNEHVSLGRLSEEGYEDLDETDKSVKKMVQEYPELQSAIGEFSEKLSGILKEQYDVNRRLRWRNKSPDKLTRIRDIMMSSVLEMLNSSLRGLEFDKFEPNIPEAAELPDENEPPPPVDVE